MPSELFSEVDTQSSTIHLHRLDGNLQRNFDLTDEGTTPALRVQLACSGFENSLVSLSVAVSVTA